MPVRGREKRRDGCSHDLPFDGDDCDDSRGKCSQSMPKEVLDEWDGQKFTPMDKGLHSVPKCKKEKAIRPA